MTLRERIADAILASQATLGGIARATGVPTATIAQFVLNESDELPDTLRPVAEKLAHHFRLQAEDDTAGRLG